MSRSSASTRHRWISRPVPPLPHPSWNRSESGERNFAPATVSAADFWDRLGL